MKRDQSIQIFFIIEKLKMIYMIKVYIINRKSEKW